MLLLKCDIWLLVVSSFSSKIFFYFYFKRNFVHNNKMKKNVKLFLCDAEVGSDSKYTSLFITILPIIDLEAMY